MIKVSVLYANRYKSHHDIFPLRVSKMNNAIFLDLSSELEFNLENDFYESCHNTPSGAKK